MITVVYSSKNPTDEYNQKLIKTCAVDNMEVIPIKNDTGLSLTYVYNLALQKAKHDIIVFTHDDVDFDTPNWGEILLYNFKRNPKYGIIGLAGADTLTNGIWWNNRPNMYGIVNHSDGNKKWESRFSNKIDNIKQVAVIDGVFIAVDRKKIKFPFDEEFKGFHYYDLSFCLPNLLNGVGIGVVTNIRLTHYSVGETNEEWEKNRSQFENKYKRFLPLMINEPR